MNAKTTVPIFFGTTDTVEEKRAFDYWQNGVMASADLTQTGLDRPFSASRMVAQSMKGAIFHTISCPFSLERRPHPIRRDSRDGVGVLLALNGRGYIGQDGNGTLLNVGDIAFQTWGKPGLGGGLTDFEEIRLTIPRATFQSQIGDVRAFAGTKIPAGPLSELFFAYVRALAQSVHTMSETETTIALESALHLLRGIMQGRSRQAEDDISANASRSLARTRIEHCLHDPEFGATNLAADLRVSRSRLYAAFAGSEGVAATIRDARLDRAYDRIIRTRKSGCRVGSIMARCGFTDPAAFSRAFRQRFGLSPRDLIAQGDA